MKRLEDLTDLPEIDVHDPAYVQDPHGHVARAREQSWIGKYNFGYMALDFQSMKDFLGDRRFRTGNRDLSKMMGIGENTAFARFQNNFLQALNGPGHDRLRALVAPSFTPRAANLHRDYMRETINKVLDQHVPAGECDFVRVAARYPISVMCRLLGIDTADIDVFEEWVDVFSVSQSHKEDTVAMVDRAIGNMFDYADKIVEARRAPGLKPDDLFQSLVELSNNGDVLSDEELRVMMISLIAGGYDTTKNQLIFLMKLLTDYPQEWEKLAADPSRVKPFIEEALRFLHPIGVAFRLPNEDIVYRDVLIPKDTLIALPMTASGRDPAVNENPDVFDVDRKSRTMVTFGQGMHMCVGMFLARALLEEALPVIVRRMPRPRVNGEVTVRPFQAIWSLNALPIAFDKELEPAES